MTARPGQLTVEADLRLQVDGAEAQIRGHGQRIDVVVDHPVQLFASAASLGRTAGLHPGRTGPRQLADAGLTLAVSSRSGELLRIGADAGRLHVRIGGYVVLRAVVVVSGTAAWFVVGRRRRRTR
ncbi:hypothetical protein [uncultured Jatrophihabitans sp.]|uniref:hypothetical protein n=1 Tax=uncultured Jatrophihabitans sp. TaxID=1610747 RepID=UPI0035CC1B02